MKKVGLSIVLLATVVTVAGVLYSRGFFNSSAKSSCVSDSLDHVYNPDRLEVLGACQTVSGTVEKVIQEADGDIHIRLKVDLSFESLLNQANYDYQYGALVLEIVCAYPVTQRDAIAACSGYSNPIAIPGVDDHISVQGQYVTDLDHGWNEIHPVFSIQVLP